MTALGHRLLEILSDSNLTAKFQQLCGIRSHVMSRAANGSHGQYQAGTTLPPPTRADDAPPGSTFTDISVDKPDNGSCHVSTSNYNNHMSNGATECVQRRNGYRPDFVVRDSIVSPDTSAKLNNNRLVGNSKQKNGKNIKKVDRNTQHENHGKENAEIVSRPAYTLEHPFLYYIFSLGAGLGNELFYILFFSSTLWNFDSLVIRKVLFVWCVTMYMGQAAKDIIRWPRPKSPPVVRLEERYALEFGMPSTHAMVGIAIPFGVIIFMFGRYEFNYSLGISIALAWSLLVSLSRLYLGMHSVLDVIAGIVFAVCLMSVTVCIVGSVDSFLMSHPMALPVTVAVCVTLSLLYPSLEKWSTARGDTTLVLGVFSGIYAGMWLTGKLTEFTHMPDSPPYILQLPSPKDVSLGVIRQISGLVVIIIFLNVIKATILHSLSWLLGYDPNDPRTKQHRPIELPYKYISYYISAMTATYLIPLLFLKLNIQRPGYYSEIFSL